MFHIRITNERQLCEAVSFYVSQIATGSKVVSGYEVSSKGIPHCHIHMEYDKTHDNLAKVLKKKFNWLQGNKNYAIQAVRTTELQNIQYCVKGQFRDKYDILVSRGFEINELDKYHNEFWDKHETKVNIDVVTEQDDNKSKSHRAFLPIVYNDLLSYKTEWTNSKADRCLIFNRYMRLSAASCKPIDKFIIARNVNGLQNSLVFQSSGKSYSSYLQDLYAEVFNESFEIDND